MNDVIAQLTRDRNALQEENNMLSDVAGEKGGEALLFRRTLEWIAYRSESRVESQILAKNALRIAGYKEPTDVTQLAEIL